MKLHQLEYFLAVAEESSFTKAAIRLTVAQPSLSTQIARLERELGGPLFERLPRGIKLTPAGRAFETEARLTVLAAARARRAARAAIGSEGGEIEIATILSIAVGLLPASISGWHKAFPGVSLGLREYRHRLALEQAVASGVGDVAIGPEPLSWSGPVVSLGEEEFVIVLPKHDKDAGSGSAPLESLSKRDWVLYDDSHGLSAFMEGACANAGFRPRGSVRTGQVEAAARLAAAGIGPALVPSNVVPPGLSAAIVHLEPRLMRPLAAYARGDFSPVVRSFVQVLRKSTSHLRRPLT